MSALAPLFLPDGATTPVTHSFYPVRIDAAGVATYADRSSGIALGFPTFTYSIRSPLTKGTSRNYKVMAKMVLPVLEVTSPSTSTGIQPAPTKAYDLIATVEFVLPERSSLQERKNLLAFTWNALANDIINNGVQSFESVY